MPVELISLENASLSKRLTALANLKGFLPDAAIRFLKDATGIPTEVLQKYFDDVRIPAVIPLREHIVAIANAFSMSPRILAAGLYADGRVPDWVDLALVPTRLRAAILEIIAHFVENSGVGGIE